MSMIGRYQKAGGFVQLLKLIETCGKQKQDNFLNMIHEEDPKWADAIKEKMLSIEKIMKWPEEPLNEICGRLQQMTIATAKHGMSDADYTKLTKTLSHSQRRAIDDLSASKKPLPPEISAAYLKILEEVRTMVKDGYLRVEKFAPELHIDDDIEEKIGKSLAPKAAASSHEAPAEAAVPNLESFGPAPAGMDPASAKELQGLRVKVQQLVHENGQLKTENKNLRERFAQIKKLAA